MLAIYIFTLENNDDFHKNLEVRKLVSYGVGWTPRACLWAQKHSGNIHGWFLNDSGTSEEFGVFMIWTSDFDTKVVRDSDPANGF